MPEIAIPRTVSKKRRFGVTNLKWVRNRTITIFNRLNPAQNKVGFTETIISPPGREISQPIYIRFQDSMITFLPRESTNSSYSTKLPNTIEHPCTWYSFVKDPFPNLQTIINSNVADPMPLHKYGQPIIHRNTTSAGTPHTMYNPIIHRDTKNPEPPSLDRWGQSWMIEFSVASLRSWPAPPIHLTKAWVQRTERLCETVHWTLQSIPLNWRSVPHNETETTQDLWDPNLKIVPHILWLRKSRALWGCLRPKVRDQIWMGIIDQIELSPPMDSA